MTRAIPLLVPVALAGLLGIAPTMTPAAGTSAAPADRSAAQWPEPVPFVSDVFHSPTVTAAVPTTRYCRRTLGRPCYNPNQIRAAYGVPSLGRAGYDGTGATIAIVDSFGSPTIRHDLHGFDQAFGLPDPPSFRIVHPAGSIPAWDGSDARVSWAVETTLDVEYAHAMAPGANIVLVVTPKAETEGVHGFPAMMKAERWVINNTKVGVISQSFGASEPTFPSESKLRSLRYAFKAADRHHVSVLAASGDTGATDYKLDMQSLYHHRVNSWPSSDPLVTSVGGTQLHLDNHGARTHRDTVWNDSDIAGGASGGGLSRFFPRPAFQNGVRAVVRGHRGTPDVSLNAANRSQVIVLATFKGRRYQPGWHFVAGTSEATPLLAGIVALAIDKAGHRLGSINPALYAMRARANSGVLDLVGGNNSYAGVDGYRARAGYDLATGWGTVRAPALVDALVKRLG